MVLTLCSYRWAFREKTPVGRATRLFSLSERPLLSGVPDFLEDPGPVLWTIPGRRSAGDGQLRALIYEQAGQSSRLQALLPGGSGRTSVLPSVQDLPGWSAPGPPVFVQTAPSVSAGEGPGQTVVFAPAGSKTAPDHTTGCRAIVPASGTGPGAGPHTMGPAPA